MEAILFIGIQASGKSTFYRDRFFDSHLRISLDMLRTRRRERALVESCLRLEQRFVLDNTHPTVADRARYVDAIREAGFRLVGYFFEPDPQAAYARNQARPESTRVPPAGLFGTLKRLERPTVGEGFDALHHVRIPAPGRFLVEPWSRGS